MVRIKNLKVDLGDFVLQDVSLDIEQGEYFIVLGPTGAGKTVLLEAIAGLYPVLGGEIWIGDREITRLDPEQRGIAIVYQDQALFPHLSVAENIAFGLKMRKYPRGEITAKVAAMVELLEISHLLGRSPATLSGGEKQRVALGRALVIEPEMLLLDEPLSALDPETKERMQEELRAIYRRVRVTTIHVTHDFEEAVALGHHVAVLNNGSIVQVGTLEEFLRQPSSEFVARFALSRNIFTGNTVDTRDGCAAIDIGGVEVAAVTKLSGEVCLSLRPEDIFVSREPLQSSARNSFPGVVSDITDRGSVVYITVSLPPDFVCLITRQAFEEAGLRKGARVWIAFKATAVHVF